MRRELISSMEAKSPSSQESQGMPNKREGESLEVSSRGTVRGDKTSRETKTSTVRQGGAGNPKARGASISSRDLILTPETSRPRQSLFGLGPGIDSLTAPRPAAHRGQA